MIDTRQPVTTGAPKNPLELVYGDDSAVVTVNGAGFSQLLFRRLLENAQMTTDLECAFFNLRNIGRFVPVPYPMVSSTDPRLFNMRDVLDGSVVDASVAIDAGIKQSKLNLNGNIPSNYVFSPTDTVTTGDPVNPMELVTDDVGGSVTVGGYPDPQQTFQYAARGDLTQFLSEKGAMNGYCRLDGTGRIPASSYPNTGTGTVNYVELDLPDELNASPAFIDHGSSTFAVSWRNAPATSWFGTSGAEGSPLVATIRPAFHTSPVPVALVPNLDASKITSGVFSLSRLPVAVGVGPDHASGMVPDPGASGAPEDYLGRDMSFKTMQPPPTYEPAVPDPSITFKYWRGVEAALGITDSLADASVFYRVNFLGAFLPVLDDTVFVNTLGGATVEAYAAIPGYTNSNIISLFIPEHRP